ncbi:DUF1330 domain-containing protein [Thalassotalea atypica]|uniref:DUF1330 domain-containing protein n=1 Tax=Thalassotalea atypica TaxID=2054316 RepID=UPI0025726E67|nr:DUF1330 domain-containing protein [Thalassotalea atypica]
MTKTYLEPTQAAGAELFSKSIDGEVVMLNLLKFKDIADYSEHPELAPSAEISGKQAYQKYMVHTGPFLQKNGGEVMLLGKCSSFFIGPSDEKWDAVMLVKQRSLKDFLAFATNEEYLKGIGHRAASLEDSRLLPIEPINS